MSTGNRHNRVDYLISEFANIRLQEDQVFAALVEARQEELLTTSPSSTSPQPVSPVATPPPTNRENTNQDQGTTEDDTHSDNDQLELELELGDRVKITNRLTNTLGRQATTADRFGRIVDKTAKRVYVITDSQIIIQRSPNNVVLISRPQRRHFLG